jgi:hypothetical protein
MPLAQSAAAAVSSRPVPTEAICGMDLITSITKLLYEAKNQLGMKLEPKHVKIEFKSEKRYKELIEENFQKPR